MRIDKLLWFLRLAKTRSLAQDLVDTGHVRRNGQRVLRCAQPIQPGDVLALPQGEGVLALRLLALPARRGPAPEAQACYERLGAMAGEAALSDRPERDA